MCIDYKIAIHSKGRYVRDMIFNYIINDICNVLNYNGAVCFRNT